MNDRNSNRWALGLLICGLSTLLNLGALADPDTTPSAPPGGPTVPLATPQKSGGDKSAPPSGAGKSATDKGVGDQAQAGKVTNATLAVAQAADGAPVGLVRIKDIADVQGVRGNQLLGY